MNPELEKVLARIAKMLRLANDPAAAEGERENALRMAHATLTKYNLTLADVSMAGTQGIRTAEARHTHEVVLDGRDWARGIAAEMARLNFCAYYVRKKWDHQRAKRSKYMDHIFLGSQANAITAGLFATEFVEHTYREYSRRKKLGRPVARSFAMGVWTSLHRRVNQLIEEDKQDAPVAALRALEDKANEDHELTKVATTAKARKRKDVDYGAFMDGVAHGDKLSLNRRVA